MDEYSIETRSANIFDRRTKDYFDEVVSSYQHGNYRSSTVMLWSVAVCDLLYKLNHMVDMYGDSTAQSILDEVGRIQSANERSSDWEFKLVEFVSTKTHLLEIQDVEHLNHLQRQRHLAAHPVLSGNSELHRPNRETVRALIRNTLDGLLTKPPVYTRKIFNEFVADLASTSEALITDEKLEAYLLSKYLSRADLQLEESLIKSLWKLVFRLVNPDCDKNRDINYRSLVVLAKRNKKYLAEIIEKDSDYYSHIATSGEPLLRLVEFLAKYTELFSKLSDAARLVIEHAIENDDAAKCLGAFAKPSLEKHAADLIEWIEGEESPSLSQKTIGAIQQLSESAEWDRLKRSIMNSYYRASWNYDNADKRFDESIKPYIEEYEEDDLLDLMRKIGENSQTYDRRGAKHDHEIVKERCDQVLGSEFDYAAYGNFSGSLR